MPPPTMATATRRVSVGVGKSGLRRRWPSESLAPVSTPGGNGGAALAPQAASAAADAVAPRKSRRRMAQW